MNGTLLGRPVRVALPPVAGAVAPAAFVVPAPSAVGIPTVPILPGPARTVSLSSQSQQPPCAVVASPPAVPLPPMYRSSVPAVVEAHPDVLYLPPASTGGASDSGGGGGGAASQRPVAEFLFHLMKMLTDPSIGHLIEWSDGRIRVHDPHALEADVLGKYFRHSKYSSFQRQLNYFGFRKVGSKGRMSPCCFVNESCTGGLASILSIKRRTATKPKGAKGGGDALTKKRKDRSNTKQEDDEEDQEPTDKKLKKSPPSATNENVPFAVTADEFGPPGSLGLPPAVSPISSAAASVSAATTASGGYSSSSGYQTDGDSSTQASSLPSSVLQPILPATAAAAARLIASSAATVVGNGWENLEASSEKDGDGNGDSDNVDSGSNDTATLAMIDQYLDPSGAGAMGAANPAANNGGKQADTYVDLAALATELGFGALSQSQADLSQQQQAAGVAATTTTMGVAAAAPAGVGLLAPGHPGQSLLMSPAGFGPRTYAPLQQEAPSQPQPQSQDQPQQQPQQGPPQGQAPAAAAPAPPGMPCPITPKLHGLLKSRSSQDFMRDFFNAFQSPFNVNGMTPGLSGLLGQSTPAGAGAATGGAPPPPAGGHILDNVKLPNLMQ